MRLSNTGTVFVFSGSEHRWPEKTLGAVRELLTSDSAFCDSMSRCDGALAEFVDWSLTEVLNGVHGGLDPGRRDVWQPVDFAVMVSLVARWRTLEVAPDAVIGVSHGEIAAAHVAGALTLRDAARIITLSANRIRDLGTTDPVELETLRKTVLVELDGLRPRAVGIEFISTITGAALDTAILDAEYWFANLRQPPLVEHAVQWAREHGYHTFVESTPEPVLAADIQRWLDRYDGRQELVRSPAQAICPSRPNNFAVSR